MMSYTWPGNIRELKNAVEYSAMMARDGIIDTRCLPLSITLRNGDIEGYFEEDMPQERLDGGIDGMMTASQTGDTGASGTETLAERVSAFEKREIKRAIKLYGNTTEGKKRAAKALGISLSSLYAKLGKERK
jgi:DNA-binding NtrC family response regulator